MVGLELRHAGRKNRRETRVAHGEGISCGTADEREVNQRAYRKGEIPVQWLCRMARFDLNKVRLAMERNGRSRVLLLNKNTEQGGRDCRQSPAARPAETPPLGKTGAEFPRF